MENSKVIPAYKKKNGTSSNSNIKYKGPAGIIKSKITIVILLIVIAVVLFGTLKIIRIFTNKGISDYDKYMKNFGFTKLYIDAEASTASNVTKLEAIKIITSSVTNVDDVSNKFYDKKESYEGELWSKYAQNIGLISKNTVTVSNYKENIKYSEVVTLLATAKSKYLRLNLQKASKINIVGIDTYSVEIQNAISDLIATEVIDNVNIDLNADITKAEFNKLIVNFVVNNNTLTLDNAKINISQEKAPNNESEYPYILYSIDKEVYEKSNYISKQDKYINPLETFATLKSHYSEIQVIVEGYYNTILNVDYNTIDETKFIANLQEYTLSTLDVGKIKEYVDYVKTNKIKISGNVKIQFPAIYFDGTNYRARVKVSYKLESPSSIQNAIYYDSIENKEIDYNNSKKEIYLDVPFKYSELNMVYYITPDSLSNMVSGKVTK